MLILLNSPTGMWVEEMRGPSGNEGSSLICSRSAEKGRWWRPTSSSPRSPFNQDQKEAVSMAVVESCEWSHVTGCVESQMHGVQREPVFRDLGHTVWP